MVCYITFEYNVQFKWWKWKGSTWHWTRKQIHYFPIHPVDQISSYSQFTFTPRVTYTYLPIYSSTYDDTCTILDTLIEEDYAGVTGEIGSQVKAMMLDAGMDPSACPQPAQSINLASSVSLPKIPTLLALLNFVDVSRTLSVTYILHIHVTAKCIVLPGWCRRWYYILDWLMRQNIVTSLYAVFVRSFRESF